MPVNCSLRYLPRYVYLVLLWKNITWPMLRSNWLENDRSSIACVRNSRFDISSMSLSYLNMGIFYSEATASVMYSKTSSADYIDDILFPGLKLILVYHL